MVDDVTNKHYYQNLLSEQSLTDQELLSRLIWMLRKCHISSARPRNLSENYAKDSRISDSGARKNKGLNNRDSSDKTLPVLNDRNFSNCFWNDLPYYYLRKHYKTELCELYLTSPDGSCPYADRCQFAHGLHDLRVRQRHPRYKTEMCYGFHTLGYCTYGRRCNFIHDEGREKLIAIHLQGRLLRIFCQMRPDIDDIRFTDLIALCLGQVYEPISVASFLPSEPHSSLRRIATASSIDKLLESFMDEGLGNNSSFEKLSYQ